MINVLFFAQLRERLGCEKLLIDNFSGNTAEHLLQFIKLQNPQWDSIISENKILVAVNNSMAKFSTELNDGDVVAFFPPVTGG
jgi:sulfur-carrier protein